MIFRHQSVFNGVALVAGGAIGAGMFALPIVSAGMWFGWAVLCLSLVWLVNLGAVLLLLESNLRYPVGASFDTMVGQSLGQYWNFFNNLAIVFIIYILLYAYFSASGSIVLQSYTSIFGVGIAISQNTASLLFGLIIALLVWLGTSTVSRLCGILLVAMVITFALSTSGLLLNVELSKLLIAGAEQSSLTTYMWAALPYFVTSFACSGIVPSLVKHYGHDTQKIKQSLIYGTLVSLIVYLLWLFVTFGNLTRVQFAPVIEAGGNIGQLVSALQLASKDQGLRLILNLFSNFAIITSFLSIGLGLFDFLADKFKFEDDAGGRAKSTLLTFLPPAILSFLFPHGFIIAIGYAGLVMLFSFYVIPVAMAYHHRRLATRSIYQAPGGRLVLWGVLIFSLIVALLKLMTILELLPVYPKL